MKTIMKIGFAATCLAVLLIMVLNMNISAEDLAQDSHDEHLGEIHDKRVMFLSTYARENRNDVIFGLRSGPEPDIDIVTIVNAKDIQDLRFNTYYETRLPRVLENFYARVSRDIYFFGVYLLMILVLISILVRENLASRIYNR